LTCKCRGKRRAERKSLGPVQFPILPKEKKKRKPMTEHPGGIFKKRKLSRVLLQRHRGKKREKFMWNLVTKRPLVSDS
jgi:CRISPR/Cas system CMR-associated protein Cmr1 (group 7 of RAMP superfamily)